MSEVSSHWRPGEEPPFGRRFGAAVYADGSYGVPRGMIFGLPLRTEDGRSWSLVDGLYLDEYANSRLLENIDDLSARRW